MTELEFTAFIKDGAEACFASRGDVIPTIFFSGRTPEGKSGILGIPVEKFLQDEDKIGQIISQLRSNSPLVAFVHLACQVEQDLDDKGVPVEEVERKHVVAILFYFGIKVEAHYAEILDTGDNPILMNWSTTEVTGGRLVAPPPSWN